MTSEVSIKVSCDVAEAISKLKEVASLLERIKVLREEIGRCSCEK
jgi:uncharacterized small protein (DUF1192 family)